MSEPRGRRRFIQNTLGAGAFLAATPAVAVGGANGRIGYALIGCGSRGMHVNRHFLRNGAACLAVCDVDRERMEKARGSIDPAPDGYTDFRKVLDRGDIDAVLIATPDHWHAPIFIAACKAGKDVYCEKPLSQNIREGRMMAEAARKHQRVSQGGTQQHSGAHYIEAVARIHAGELGKITKVMCWNTWNESSRGPLQPSPPPENLDWDMWLGPAPEAGYSPQRCHGSFRYFWDYSGGRATDFGVHHLDIVQWALRQTHPASIVSEGGHFLFDDFRETPDTQDTVYRYEGCLVQHSIRCGNDHERRSPFDIFFYGTEGTLFVNRSRYAVWPERGADNPPAEHEWANPARQDEMTTRHVAEFLEKIITRELCSCDVEVCHRATSASILGNIAYRTGERLAWDGAAERITNHPGLNAWLGRDNRPPWDIRP